MYLEIILLFLTLYFAYVFFAKPETMPPGTYGYPIIGNLPPSGKSVTEHFAEMKRKYGNIFTTKWGIYPTVILAEHDILKKAFSHPDIQGRPNFYSVKAMNRFKDGGIILEDGHIWQENRRFMLKNLRDLGMGKTSLESSIQDEAEMLVKYLDSMDLDKPVEIDWSINVAVLNVIWQMLASKRYEPDDKFIIQFTANANKDLQIMQGLIFFVDIMPWIRYLFPRRIFEKITEMDEYTIHREQFTAVSMEMIKDHEDTLDRENPRDIIDMYLVEMEETKGKEGGALRNYDDLLITMNDMFFAGSETTATSLRWIILYMALNPEVQHKIHQVLDLHVPKDRTPSLEDRHNLQYVDAVILEALRMSSLLKLGLFHVTTKELDIEGYTLAKGTMVIGSLELIHRDPELWLKPYEFYPEHFLTEDGKLNSKKSGFVPFSVGRRQCLGESLARMELYLFTVAILQRFIITPPEGVQLDTSTDDSKKILNQPNPFKVVLTRRNFD